MDMTEKGDLVEVSKAENCQHRINELKRIEHFKVQLGIADEKLIQVLQKNLPTCSQFKRKNAIISKFVESLSVFRCSAKRVNKSIKYGIV